MWCCFGANDLEVEINGEEAEAPSDPAIRPVEFYVHPESIYEQLIPSSPGKPPAVRLLDSEWVLARADLISAAATDAERAERALPRRQDLEASEPHAFMSIEQIKSLPLGGRPGMGDTLAIGSVSHAWLTQSHPDPLGEQLVRLASVIRKAQRGEMERQREANMERHGLKRPYQALPARFALFFDWASLFQSKKAPDGTVLLARTEAEDDAFQRALGSMQIWYAHQKLFALLVTDLPPRCADVRPPSERGWPTVERQWTMVAKTNAQFTWPMIYDVSIGDEAPRQPPMRPERLAELLKTKHFTSPKADHPLVLRLYRETILSLLGGIETLNNNRVGWGAHEAASLAQVLSFCTRVEHVSICQNQFGDDGCVALMKAVCEPGTLPCLERWRLNGNGIGDVGCHALAAALRAGAMPQLEVLDFKDNDESTKAREELRSAARERNIRLK